LGFKITGDLSGISTTGEGMFMIPIRPYGAGQVHSVLKWAKVCFFNATTPFIFHIFQTVNNGFFQPFPVKRGVFDIILCPRNVLMPLKSKPGNHSSYL